MTARRTLHPTLKQLGYPATGKLVPALDLLSHLLKNEVLSVETVEDAFKVLQETKESEKIQKKQAKKAKVEPVKRHTRHIALRFYYDGSNYSGLAENVGMETDQSIEKAVFAGLMKTRLVENRERCGYSRCGRTDRGVSSAGQVIALRVRSNFPLESSRDEQGASLMKEADLPKNSHEKVTIWVPPKKETGPRIQKEISEYPFEKILNNVLPPDIRILGWSPVSNEFSARFSATTRLYRYFFVKRTMNLGKMREALSLMNGNHDFRNFCKMDVSKVYNFERKIHATKLVECDGDKQGLCYFEILGQAFLWHQIRCIVSVLFMIGRELEDVSIVSELLDIEKHPGKPSYPLAHERPLVLHNCGYPNLQFGHSCLNLWTVRCHFEEQWEELTLAAARIRNGIESMRDSMVQRAELLEFARGRLEGSYKRKRKHMLPHEMDGSSLESGLQEAALISWKEALEWLASKGLPPCPYTSRDVVHIPMLQRSKGTTYEEKIDALCENPKRRGKYEENVIKKRKTKEEDQAFYDHMIQQGGSGV